MNASLHSWQGRSPPPPTGANPDKTDMRLTSARLSGFVFIPRSVSKEPRNFRGSIPNTPFVESSGVQVLKNPNPLKDVEALAVLDVVVLV